MEELMNVLADIRDRYNISDEDMAVVEDAANYAYAEAQGEVAEAAEDIGEDMANQEAEEDMADLYGMEG